jgi:D-tyrosyl-tRNA(Tyr) deacylase
MRRAWASGLLLATSSDPASFNIYQHLLNKFQWQEISKSFSTRKLYCIQPMSPNPNIFADSNPIVPPLYMWLVHEPTVYMNYPEKAFREEFINYSCNMPSPEVNEILFLSRHAAASGTVSLTVHPVGIPWMSEPSRAGGIPHRCAPPSSRMAALYRSITEAVKSDGLAATFQTSLEATHHGPFSEVPVCYVEIGSSENEWSNEHAGEIWANTLGNHFYLPKQDGSKIELKGYIDIPREQRLVVMLIGGGHYVPKLSDMVRTIVLYNPIDMK